MGNELAILAMASIYVLRGPLGTVSPHRVDS